MCGSGEGQLLYQVDGPLVRLTINRPDQRNALNDEVVEGLLGSLERAAQQPGARCIVLTGAGDRAFCAGADLATSMSSGQGAVERDAALGRIGQVLAAMAKHPLPIVARVNGIALAGGFGLMLACDMAVAADDVEVGTPEVNLGLWPFMISAVMVRNVPRKIAMEMMLTGRRLRADQAARWGMLNCVVPRQELDQEVERLAGELSSKAPVAVRLGKESFYRAQDMGFEESLAYLNEMLSQALQSEDVAEGIAAFLEKRKPQWKGR